MVTYDMVEQMASVQLRWYAGYVPPHYKEHVIAMMCNTIMIAKPTTKEVAENMLRGMCHIFVYGMDCQVEKEL